MSYKFIFFTCALNLFYYVPNLFASPVIGGQEDFLHTNKYHVSIKYMYDYRIPKSGKLLCGGAIIQNKYVLTAAHCFMIKRNGDIETILQPSTSRVVVLAGTSETHGPGIIRDVLKVFIPHVYDMQMKYGDIAILELAVDLQVAANPDRLEILPLDSGTPFELYENKNALVPGNGCNTLHIGYGGVWRTQRTQLADRRQVLVVHMIERSLCSEFDHSICALNDDTSEIHACTIGDNGSPLVYENIIIGVLSRVPTVFQGMRNGMIFTRVATFHYFIMDAMNGDYSQMYTLDN